MFDRFFLNLLSKPGLSRTTARFADTRLSGPVLRTFLRWYIRHYKVSMDEVLKGLEEFTTFNEFFTRELIPGSRQVDMRPDVLVAPSDGLIVAVDAIGEDRQLGQIKGTTYSLDALLDDSELAGSFVGGTQVTIYLSPRDYHRVHAPSAGTITRLRHIAGKCYPVNEWAASHIANLYGVNERVIITMDASAFGSIGVVMVGAANVARISLAFHDLTSNNRTPGADLSVEETHVARGDELGRFNLGSTVVLLVPKRSAHALTCSEGDVVKMGQALLKSR